MKETLKQEKAELRKKFDDLIKGQPLTLEEKRLCWVMFVGGYFNGLEIQRKRVLELLRSDDAYQLNKHIFHYESKPKGWVDWLEAKLSEMDKKEGD